MLMEFVVFIAFSICLSTSKNPFMHPVNQTSDLMAQLLVEPDMYLDKIQTWVVISYDIGIMTSTLLELIRDVGFSYKYLHKAAAEWNEDEWEKFWEWAQETLVPEMIVAVDKSSKDDCTLY